MKLFFYIISVVFTFGQLGRLSFNNQLINGYLYEVLLLCFFIWLFIRHKVAPLKKILNSHKNWLYFFIWIILSFLATSLNYSINQNIVSGFYIIRLLFYPLFFFYLYQEKHFFKQSKFLPLIFLLIILTSFTQYFFYPDLRNLYYAGWDPHFNRAFGLFFDTSISGSIYGMLFIYGVVNNYFFVIWPFLILMILSFSRSTWIASFLVLFLKYAINNFKKLVILVVIFSLFLLIVPKNFGLGVGLNRTFSIKSRLIDYKTAFDLFIKSPIIGYGYNRIQFIRNDSNQLEKNIPSHANANFSSSYMNILLGSGLMGLILFGLLLKDLLFINRSTFYLVFFLILMSFFDNVIIHPFIMFVLGLIMISSNTKGNNV